MSVGWGGGRAGVYLFSHESIRRPEVQVMFRFILKVFSVGLRSGLGADT